jgi:hypothetical protein
MKLEYPHFPMFLTSQRKPREPCPWGEDYALKTLYQVVANNHIPPYLDIPMDPIRI